MAKVNRLAELARETDENYLKTMWLIHLQKGRVCAADLVEAMQVNTSSTYSAMTKLVEHS